MSLIFNAVEERPFFVQCVLFFWCVVATKPIMACLLSGVYCLAGKIFVSMLLTEVLPLISRYFFGG